MIYTIDGKAETVLLLGSLPMVWAVSAFQEQK